MSEKIQLSGFEDLKAYEGKEFFISDYLVITQDRINQFAEATSDHQWIHVDAERAGKESPFKTTIAHGYLTMCLAPYFFSEAVDFSQAKFVINYGLDNMRLMEPVKVE